MGSPMDFFNAGSQIGQANAPIGAQVSKSILDVFNERAMSQLKMQDAISLERAKNQISSPKDEAMTRYYDTMSNSMSGQSSQPQNVQSIAQTGGFDQEDYQMNPTVNRYKGMTNVVNTPELKPPLDSKSTSQITDLRSMHQNMTKNLKMMTPGVMKFMNPLDPRAQRGGWGSEALKIQGALGDKDAQDFSTFKAETDKMFQAFRKDVTGAQAALKELGWIAPDFPEPNDPPALYMKKAKEALKRVQDGETLLLDTYSQRGFRVGELRKGSLSQNPLQQASNKMAPERVAELRQEAQNAITRGGDPEKVKNHFRNLTQEEF